MLTSETSYLIDTNVISIRAPSQVAAAKMDAWMDANSAKLFISVVAVAEIEDGIAKASREGATCKSRDISAWLETLPHLYAARILPVDLATATLLVPCLTRPEAKAMPPASRTF